jgi:D-Tyr-tRNAtyr deacylase
MSQMSDDPLARTPATPMGNDTATNGDTRVAVAREEAGAVADTARAEAGDIATTAKVQAGAVVDDAKHQARRVVDETRSQLMRQAADQTGRLAGSVREVSQQLHAVTQQGATPSGIVADVADQAAEVAARFADRLDGRSPEDLLGEVRTFARRRPGIFLAGAVGAGFLAGRLVKAIDTGSVAEAAKAGAQPDQASSSHGAATRPAGDEPVGAVGSGSMGSGSMGGLQSAVRP